VVARNAIQWFTSRAATRVAHATPMRFIDTIADVGVAIDMGNAMLLQARASAARRASLALPQPTGLGESTGPHTAQFR